MHDPRRLQAKLGAIFRQLLPHQSQEHHMRFAIGGGDESGRPTSQRPSPQVRDCASRRLADSQSSGEVYGVA